AQPGPARCHRAEEPPLAAVLPPHQLGLPLRRPPARAGLARRGQAGGALVRPRDRRAAWNDPAKRGRNSPLHQGNHPMTRPLPFLFLACLLLARPVSGRAAGAPDKSPKSDPSPEAEQASFVVHPDFETTLYADESLGIANPVAIHWDAQGRLWVLC